MTLSPRQRRFVMWMAQVALIIYVSQIVAIDHWHSDPSETAGKVNSNAHARHCHGSSSCAEGASVSTAMLKPAVSPLPPAPRLLSDEPSMSPPAEAVVDTLLRPPRAA